MCTLSVVRLSGNLTGVVFMSLRSVHLIFTGCVFFLSAGFAFWSAGIGEVWLSRGGATFSVMCVIYGVLFQRKSGRIVV